MRLLLLALLACLCAAQADAYAGRRPVPNIVVVLCDDCGFDDIANATTPTLDTLATNGAVFENFYTEQLCGASRALYSTMQSAARTGMNGLTTTGNTGGYNLVGSFNDSASQRYARASLQKAIHQDSGYTTSGYNSAQVEAGYHYFRGFNQPTPAGDYWSRGSGDQFIVQGDGEGGVSSAVGDASSAYLTTEMETHADAWMDGIYAADPSRPVYMVLSYYAAHIPTHDGGTTGCALPNRECEEDMVARVDTSLGGVLDHAALTGKPTVVIFWSDNGPTGTYSKNTLNEGGVNVPLIISGGQVQALGTVSDYVWAPDLGVTVQDIADNDLGLNTGNDIDGKSLRSFLYGETTGQAGADGTVQTDFIYLQDGTPRSGSGDERCGIMPSDSTKLCITSAEITCIDLDETPAGVAGDPDSTRYTGLWTSPGPAQCDSTKTALEAHETDASYTPGYSDP